MASFRLARNRMQGWMLLSVAIGLATGCQPRVEFAPPPPPTVVVSQPLVQDIPTHIEEIGVTEASETIEIRARVEGYLEEIKFHDGQEVRAGDLLFVIDRKPFEAERTKASAELKFAIAGKQDAEAKYRRACSRMHCWFRNWQSGRISEVGTCWSSTRRIKSSAEM